MAPVVSTCGLDATVQAGFCHPSLPQPDAPLAFTSNATTANIPDFCDQQGAASPKCRNATIGELAATSGRTVAEVRLENERRYPRLVQSGCDAGSCPVCHSDCDDDDDCADGLVCFNRDVATNTPPGCDFHPYDSAEQEASEVVDENDDVSAAARFAPDLLQMCLTNCCTVLRRPELDRP